MQIIFDILKNLLLFLKYEMYIEQKNVYWRYL